MSTLTLSARTGPDGILHLSLPLGPVNSDVTVTIRISADPLAVLLLDPPPLTFEESVGSLADMDLRRPDQLPLEERRPFD